MPVPTDRDSFKDLILRRLGKGAHRVELTDDQLDDQVDFALAKYTDYHFDGSREVFYKYQITPTDITNLYIPIPESTIGVVEIFDLTSTLMGVGMWNVQYQFILSNLPNWVYLDLTQYWMTMSHLQLLQQILVGKQSLRYNRYEGNLYIDMDWTRVNAGDYLIVRLYQAIDPDTYTGVWGDQWLQHYAYQLAKRQWGENLSKYTGTPLPSGMSFDGQRIYSDAQTEIEKLEEQLINSYSLPPSMMMG